MIYKNNKLVVNLLHGNKIIDKVYKNNLVVYQKNKTDELPNYFKITALEPGTINMTKSDKELYWSTDGKSWTLSPTSESTISVEATTGTNLYLRGSNTIYDYNSSGAFTTSTCNYNISGNIMSLFYDEVFEDRFTFPENSTYILRGLFMDDTHLINAKDLVLPATYLASYCYSGMFLGCTSLTTAPELPATTLADYCYNNMFYNCASLTTTPELPATDLISCCYLGMFRGCTSLTTAPELPATTLAYRCYQRMFASCTGLTTAPELPVTTLVQECYRDMFSNCTGLTTAPELHATRLAIGCYYSMFQNCTSLTTAPELPATSLVRNCYKQMFTGCTNLNYIKAMFTTSPSTTYTSYWVQGVASTGTFVKNSAATWNVTGATGIPNGWTVELADS